MTEPFSASVRERLLGTDPVPWLLSGDEPAATWYTLTAVCGLPLADARVAAAHAATMADPATEHLLRRISDWNAPGRISGHDAPAFLPNLLNLLADMGLGADDDPRLAATLKAMASHQDDDGRFSARLDSPRLPGINWTSLLCDTHAITGVLARFGLGSDPRVRRASGQMLADVTATEQGRAWPCLPDPETGFRGPGRKADMCPQVTAEALRALSDLPEPTLAELELDPDHRDGQNDSIDAAVGSLLAAWLERGARRPYMFGHGRRFKQAKWPLNWYNSVTVLDAVGRYPQSWLPPSAGQERTKAVAELAACVIAYNLDPATGRCTPKSCFRGFETFSFGQKKDPSPFATARVLGVLARVATLAEEIVKVDVRELASSKGGSGRSLPPS
ncbi:MAG: hypothetical protein U0904_04600 [Candidatus Nanopelagicales bacterium]|nr:hypothetical protein [Candidatus Nanopelagicales bacterium]